MGRETCSVGDHNTPLPGRYPDTLELLQDKPDRWRRHVAVFCQYRACRPELILGYTDFVPHGVDDLLAAGVERPMLDVSGFQSLRRQQISYYLCRSFIDIGRAHV